jgi:hypothetical protein
VLLVSGDTHRISYELVAVTSEGLIPFENGDYVYSGTTVRFYFEVNGGYEVTQLYFDGSYGKVELTCLIDVNGNRYCEFTKGYLRETIGIYVEPISEYTYPINIDNGSEFAPYEIHIDNGSGWDEYAAHIDDGTSWHLYS